MEFRVGDKVAGQLVGLQEWEGVIEGIDVKYLPISPDVRAEYLMQIGLFYTVRIDSSTCVSGLRADQLTLVGVPAQGYLDLFI